MGYIDADTHVLETDATWSYLDPSEREFTPQTVVFENNTQVGRGLPVSSRMWIIADSSIRRHPADCRPGGYGKDYEDGVGFLTDVGARVRNMDAMGIDVQVLISSTWLGLELENPRAEAALARSYNRWLAECTADERDRLPWLLVPPLGTMDRALEELEFGKANGARGVLLHGMERGLYLNDPYFFPFYEKAQDLDLAMVIHVGVPFRRVPNLQIGNIIPTEASMVDHLGYAMKGFWAVVTSDFDKRFPRLRWAVVEGGSTWVPLVFQQQQRLLSTSVPAGYHGTPLGTSVRITRLDVAEIMAAHNLYVACESDEDLPYLTALVGPDRLVFGTDYCHNDIGADPLGHTLISLRNDLDATVAGKIVDDNGRALYGIPADFRPADSQRAIRALQGASADPKM